MKNLDATKKIFKIEIFMYREKKKFLSHKSYINKVLTRFKMSSDKSINILCAANLYHIMYVVQSKEEIDYMSRVSYVSAIGGLIYTMVCPNSDLEHAVNMVSKFMGQPGKE